MFDILRQNLRSPIALACALGLLARIARREFQLPREIYAGLSIHLLFAIGLHGGVELAHAPIAAITLPALATLTLGLVTPVSRYLILHHVGRFPVRDAVGIAAHFESVSAVTFIAAQQLAKAMGAEPEGFMPTLLTLMEAPGIQVALAIGALQSNGGARPIGEALHAVLTGRTMVLLVGGLLIGAVIGETNWQAIGLVSDTKGAIFKGALCLFLLEMGVVAGARLSDLRRVCVVTIVAEPVLEERLIADIRLAGARSYTVSVSHGEGSRGIRASDPPGVSIRIEVVASDEVADRLLTRLAERYVQQYAVNAWMTAARVVRGEKYA